MTNLLQSLEAVRGSLKHACDRKSSNDAAKSDRNPGDHMDIVRRFFNIDERHAVLMSIFILEGFEDNHVTIKDIHEELQLSISEVEATRAKIEGLVKRSWVSAVSGRTPKTPMHKRYEATPLVINAVMQGNRRQLKPRVARNLREHLLVARKAVEELVERTVSVRDMHRRLARVHRQGLKYPLISWLDGFRLPAEQLAMTYFVMAQRAEGNDDIDAADLLRPMFPDSLQRAAFRIELINGGLEVVRKNLIDVDNQFGGKHVELNVGRPLMERMAEADLVKLQHRKQENPVVEHIEHGKIVRKKLIFEPAFDAQLGQFRKVCHPDNFAKVQQQLRERRMGSGIIVLMHGVPGSGKTESVLQIAADTGRNVMKVEISKVRNKWVGESERNLQRIFDEYRDCAATAEQKPILLFNEADALLGRRITNVASSSDQMNNSMQNILLEAFERFDGILVATTNLVSNLDSAFERRFTYKFRFERTGEAVRHGVWRQHFPEVEEGTLRSLAEEYDLSPAEIENIAKKCRIRSIVEEGWEPDFDSLCRIADEESTERRRKGGSIGFRQAAAS